MLFYVSFWVLVNDSTLAWHRTDHILFFFWVKLNPFFLYSCTLLFLSHTDLLQISKNISLDYFINHASIASMVLANFSNHPLSCIIQSMEEKCLPSLLKTILYNISWRMPALLLWYLQILAIIMYPSVQGRKSAWILS